MARPPSLKPAYCRDKTHGQAYEHATRHGVSVAECEQVVRAGRYRQKGDGKYRAVGRGTGGRWLQVVFALTEDDEVFVIHARPLTELEKHRERRGKQ